MSPSRPRERSCVLDTSQRPLTAESGRRSKAIAEPSLPGHLRYRDHGSVASRRGWTLNNCCLAEETGTSGLTEDSSNTDWTHETNLFNWTGGERFAVCFAGGLVGMDLAR